MPPDWLTVTFPRSVEHVAPHVTPHVTPHVAAHVGRLVEALRGEMSRAELMRVKGLGDRRHFVRTYLRSGFGAGLVEMALPHSPSSRTQKYRLTALGRQCGILSRLTRIPEPGNSVPVKVSLMWMACTLVLPQRKALGW